MRDSGLLGIRSDGDCCRRLDVETELGGRRSFEADWKEGRQRHRKKKGGTLQHPYWPPMRPPHPGIARIRTLR